MAVVVVAAVATEMTRDLAAVEEGADAVNTAEAAVAAATAESVPTAPQSST